MSNSRPVPSPVSSVGIIRNAAIHELRMRMSDLSEFLFSSGWPTDWEFIVWDAMHNGALARDYGFFDRESGLTEAMLTYIWNLSHALGVWCAHDVVHQLPDWKVIVAGRK